MHFFKKILHFVRFILQNYTCNKFTSRKLSSFHKPYKIFQKHITIWSKHLKKHPRKYFGFPRFFTFNVSYLHLQHLLFTTNVFVTKVSDSLSLIWTKGLKKSYYSFYKTFHLQELAWNKFVCKIFHFRKFSYNHKAFVYEIIFEGQNLQQQQLK